MEIFVAVLAAGLLAGGIFVGFKLAQLVSPSTPPTPAQAPAPARAPPARTRYPNSFVAEFVTRAGNSYRFSFESVGGGCRAYVLQHPSYAGRDTSLHATHRLRDGDRYYVCWSSPLRTSRDAMQVARQWAEMTDRYIANGKTF